MRYILTTLTIIAFIALFALLNHARQKAGYITPGFLSVVLVWITYLVIKSIRRNYPSKIKTKTNQWIEITNIRNNENPERIITTKNMQMTTNTDKIGNTLQYSSLKEELKAKCIPSNFTYPYDDNKVKVANKLYPQILSCSPDDETKLKELRDKAANELNITFSN